MDPVGEGKGAGAVLLTIVHSYLGDYPEIGRAQISLDLLSLAPLCWLRALWGRLRGLALPRGMDQEHVQRDG